MSKASILIVEDERLVAEDIKTRLMDLDYQILDVLDSGADTLELLQKSRPQLILMDIILRGNIDGVETAELIKQNYDIPIVYLTSHADEQTLIRVKKSQPSGYIIKPFVDEELNAVIETALYKYRMEAELKEREAWLTTTLASIGDGVIATDSDGKIVFINPVAADLSEWSENKAVGKSIHDVLKVVQESDEYQLDSTVFKVMSGEQYKSQSNLFLQRSEKKRIPIEVTMAPIRNEQSETLGIVIVFRDITQRVKVKTELENERQHLAQRVSERTEELSVANAELARAVRLKDEFLANMSHELRTPLNAILGMSEAMQENVYGDLNDRQNHSLDIIQESGHHLLSLINDILDISKIEAGKIEFQLSVVDVKGLIASSLSMIKQIAHKKRIHVHPKISSSVTVFSADERRLKQILVNLLSNAVKFTPDGGDVFLNVIADSGNGILTFQIKDTGIGIKQEDMERLFQPFEQLDSRLSRAHAGTGLGLALVRKLTEMHGGGIHLESEFGKGSCFSVSIPWIREESVTLASSSVRKISGSEISKNLFNDHTILLVDDNEQNLQAVREYLTQKGFNIIIGRNGTEAINLHSSRKPSLILMDIQMPGMDGLEAIRRIRNGENNRATPIIALTALAMPNDHERCISAGANEYFGKPVSLRALYIAIVKHLNIGSDN